MLVLLVLLLHEQESHIELQQLSQQVSQDELHFSLQLLQSGEQQASKQ